MTPKTRWIVAILALLGGNIAALITLAVVAHVGQSEVIPNYYEESTHHDDTLRAAEASRALGWRVDATLSDGALHVTVRDAAGAPLSGARVRASGYPRTRAHERIDIALTAGGGGSYRGIADRTLGLHDLAITVERDGKTFAQRVMVEAL
jgi:nitrogen fixation protein FixH